MGGGPTAFNGSASHRPRLCPDIRVYLPVLPASVPGPAIIPAVPVSAPVSAPVVVFPVVVLPAAVTAVVVVVTVAECENFRDLHFRPFIPFPGTFSFPKKS